MLGRVVDNLIDNAVKFTPQGGRVSVTAAAQPLRPNATPNGPGDAAADAAQQGCVVIRVKDTGPGIAAEEIPLIFDRYHQGEARRQGKTRGNGLGLAFCREALGLMGAQISVRSQVGRGSEFVITIPASS